MDFKKNLKIGHSQVGKMYIVAAILRNALTCLYGNETSQVFLSNPPSLHEYFSLTKQIRFSVSDVEKISDPGNVVSRNVFGENFRNF